MMIPLVSQFVLGAMLSPQIGACWPTNVRPWEVMKNVTETIMTLPRRVLDLKINYDETLINLRKDETNNMYNESIMSLASNIMPIIMNVSLGQEGRFGTRCADKYINYQLKTLRAAKEIQNCVESQLDALKPVEEKIQNFLKKMKSCVLMYDDAVWRFCNGKYNSSWRECSDVNRLYNIQTQVPHICDGNQWRPEMMILEDDLKQTSNIGISDATQCIQRVKTNCNVAVVKIHRELLQCIENIV